MPRKGFSPYKTIYTRASTSDGNRRFFPSDEPIRRSANLASVHCLADVLNLTGDMKIWFAFQESDDPENWPAADTYTLVDSGQTPLTADGIAALSAFISLSLNKAFVRFGVACRNDSGGSRIELAWVSTRFETRSC